MRTEEISLSKEVYDLFAITDHPGSNTSRNGDRKSGLLAGVLSCNRLLPIRTPTDLRDWVSTPKANGYESLHTTVMSRTGKLG